MAGNHVLTCLSAICAERAVGCACCGGTALFRGSYILPALPADGPHKQCARYTSICIHTHTLCSSCINAHTSVLKNVIFYSCILCPSGIDGLSLDITTLVDIRDQNNKELAMRLVTDIQSEDTFYTDLNGFQVGIHSFSAFSCSSCSLTH